MKLFHSDDVLLRDKPRPGRSSDLDQDDFGELVECNPSKSTRELALDLNTSQSLICCHLKKRGYISSLVVWLLHSLNHKNKENRITRVTSFL